MMIFEDSTWKETVITTGELNTLYIRKFLTNVDICDIIIADM